MTDPDLVTETSADRVGAVGGGETPAVTVILPAYQAEAFIEDSLEQLLQQSMDDFEVVVVDDGSTDRTAEVARGVAGRDARVRVVGLEHNVGVARARERAVAESRGEYLWFIDADDERDRLALEKLLAAARRTRADLVICAAEYVYGEDRRRLIAAPVIPRPISGRLAFRSLLEGSVTGHLWNKLVRREIAARIDFTPARVHSDLAMVAQFIAGSKRVVAIDDVLYSYLLRQGSIIRSGSRRAESLALVQGAVERAARSMDARIVGTPEYHYFLIRFIVLSALKDAQVGPYGAEERAALMRRSRSELTLRSLLILAGRRDARRLVLASAAMISPRLHRAILTRSAERLASDG